MVIVYYDPFPKLLDLGFFSLGPKFFRSVLKDFASRSRFRNECLPFYFSYYVGFIVFKSSLSLRLRGCVGSRQVLPSWGGETGLTLLRLAILPSSWVLAVLEVAIPVGTHPT